MHVLCFEASNERKTSDRFRQFYDVLLEAMVCFWHLFFIFVCLGFLSNLNILYILHTCFVIEKKGGRWDCKNGQENRYKCGLAGWKQLGSTCAPKDVWTRPGKPYWLQVKSPQFSWFCLRWLLFLALTKGLIGMLFVFLIIFSSRLYKQIQVLGSASNQDVLDTLVWPMANIRLPLLRFTKLSVFSVVQFVKLLTLLFSTV